jgi:hypothetical protein
MSGSSYAAGGCNPLAEHWKQGPIMAELTIRLRRDPQTGKHDIIIDLKSDEDALPHEHEQMHRQAVEKLIGKENVGKVIVEREQEATPAAPKEEPPQQERRAEGQAG